MRVSSRSHRRRNPASHAEAPPPFKLTEDGFPERLKMLWNQFETVLLCRLT